MADAAFESFAREVMPWLLDKPLDDNDRLMRATAKIAFASGQKATLGGVNKVLDLLRECAVHLPIAAAGWNASGDEDDRQMADFHVPRVLDLLERVNAALADQSTNLASQHDGVRQEEI